MYSYPYWTQTQNKRKEYTTNYDKKIGLYKLKSGYLETVNVWT